ncbi:EAL domain-containing protein [Gulbenkiania mobilis]|uniref:EAL domain-containing protein (Putative c-di-GMP-specific phosphodiesterase class I) n=1 Tax=Gulbenkiania mobilis TaxID=397457 RepID=A0ABY2CWZ9_GULMO|nr:EAL domain-containing protein (putative c-di-GMP-specific phosphodiesterase class I) [Gulbenkiania mobilis]
MKRFQQGKAPPPGYCSRQIDACQALLAAQACPVRLGWNAAEVFAEFDGWWLTSAFTPVVDRAGRLAAMAARLHIHGHFGQTLPADWLFALHYAEPETLALLQAVRVLHLLNHRGRHPPGTRVRLDLDPRLCHARSLRIVDFTADVLERLALPASDVDFLLFADASTLDTARALVTRYRALGHGLALGGFGTGAQDLLHLWQTEPDGLVLAPRIMAAAFVYPVVREAVLTLMPQLVAQGYTLGVDDIACGRQLRMARQMGASRYAGPYEGLQQQGGLCHAAAS